MMRERFYWPRMFQEIKAWCEQCERCCLRKTPSLRAPMVSIHSSAPIELVCVDFLTLEKSKGGIENVLIMTDHFSRFAQASQSTSSLGSPPRTSHVDTVIMSKLCMTVCHRPMPRPTRYLGMLRDSRKSTMTKKQGVKSSAQGIEYWSKCVMWRGGRN